MRAIHGGKQIFIYRTSAGTRKSHKNKRLAIKPRFKPTLIGGKRILANRDDSPELFDQVTSYGESNDSILGGGILNHLEPELGEFTKLLCRDKRNRFM